MDAIPKTATDQHQQLPTTFENAAGRYELLRIEGNHAQYRFINHDGETKEAAMPIASWRRAARAK